MLPSVRFFISFLYNKLMENTERRSTRIRKAPIPIYVPDPDTKFEDDYDQSSEEESASIDGGYSDDDSEYDSSEDEGLPRTKAGYALDDFIVDDDQIDSEAELVEGSEEETDDYISSDEE